MDNAVALEIESRTRGDTNVFSLSLSLFLRFFFSVFLLSFSLPLSGLLIFSQATDSDLRRESPPAYNSPHICFARVHFTWDVYCASLGIHQQFNGLG
jgi:hypothetical protein